MESDGGRRPTHGQILDAIRVHGALARVELAEALGLSAATVTAATADLMSDGLVEVAPERSAGLDLVEAARRGRPRVRLRLRADAAHVVGVKLSLHQISVAVTNFVGDILASDISLSPVSDAPVERIAAQVRDAMETTLAAAGLRLADIAGVGVGAPGFIDAASGDSLWSPIFGPERVDVRGAFEAAIGRPVHVDNDANLAALAEQWFGVGRGVDDFVVVTIEHGVGMGAVIGGALWRGGRGFGCEFGHTKIRAGDALCRCGQRGCIEAYLADYAILREASLFAPVAAPDDPAARRRAVDALVDRGLSGDARVADIYARAGEILGVGVANLVNLLNPRLVIVSGEDARAAPLFEPAMRAALEQAVVSAASEGLDVRVRRTSDVSWAHGAAALVLRRVDGRQAGDVRAALG